MKGLNKGLLDCSSNVHMFTHAIIQYTVHFPHILDNNTVLVSIYITYFFIILILILMYTMFVIQRLIWMCRESLIRSCSRDKPERLGSVPFEGNCILSALMNSFDR